MPAVGVHNHGLFSGSSAVTTAALVTRRVTTVEICVIGDQSKTITSVTDSFGNKWVQVGSDVTGTAPITMRAARWRSVNAAGGAGHTVSINFSAATQVTVFFHEIVSLDADFAQADASNQAQDVATPFTVSIAASFSGELLVGFLGAGSASNPATHAESTGFAIVEQETNGSVNYPGCVAAKSVTPVDTFTVSFTETGAGDGLTFLAGYRDLNSQDSRDLAKFPVADAWPPIPWT